MRGLILVIYHDVRNFFRYRWWVVGLLSMNLADLFVFAVVFTNLVRIDYLRFFAPGLIIASLFASAFFIGREVNWEIRRGLSLYLLRLPMKRTELILARILSGGVRGIIYSTPLVVLLFLITGVPDLSEIFLIYVFLFSLAVGVSSLSVGAATLFKNLETYVTFRSMLYFALYFASSVFYPLNIIKEALPLPVYVFAKYNPLSNGADILRLITIQKSTFKPLMAFNIFFFSFIFSIVGSVLYFETVERT